MTTAKLSRETLARLQADITRHDTPENRLNYQRFSKTILAEPEAIKLPILRKIAAAEFRKLRQHTPADILACCDALLDSELRYMRFFAFDFADRCTRGQKPADFARFERWLRRFVSSWDSCDQLCGGALGHLLLQFPDLAARTVPWRTSKNLWLRRAAAVALIVPVRKALLLQTVMACAKTLLCDPEDLVQKGYGWMLKEASKAFPDQIFAFVMAHRSTMPRTALRYAIEKFPEARRRQAMKT